MAEVIRSVVSQQLFNLVLGIVFMSEGDMRGREEYDVAVWATRIRMIYRAVPKLLAVAGIDAKSWAINLANSCPALAAAVMGRGTEVGFKGPATASGFTTSELLAANLIYWYIVPALQFCVAIFIADSWQYLCHRVVHMNKWLYTNFHSVHHQFYVPYAFGAFYAHFAEAVVFDTIGTTAALILSGLTTRQALWFINLSVMKSIDDHCGYSLPWNPFQWINEQTAAYHDIHHQNWGMKTNFAQVYSTFWDHALGTVWTGDNLTKRYEQGRISAQRWTEHAKTKAETDSSPKSKVA
ncbi:hypothetical protein MMC22_001898 [Lobaria immixta]|nr:hypothetical protein [Lobaria immixta]